MRLGPAPKKCGGAAEADAALAPAPRPALPVPGPNPCSPVRLPGSASTPTPCQRAQRGMAAAPAPPRPPRRPPLPSALNTVVLNGRCVRSSWRATRLPRPCSSAISATTLPVSSYTVYLVACSNPSRTVDHSIDLHG
jgi:hypothetical protein